ncbi:flagellar filament capping protein FliD [Curvivirga aplysinae]|uniref:flagellar filament capping protein FliD n=1 Tax=Curvivirga aplysinae TaxID=2529852 RepID=UPI0012BC298A|nr:flagellar filament capping protein FliD [Curvivirga aplysinae]MTI09722.1 flagellar hook protein [Curvivirga aplysinae]
MTDVSGTTTLTQTTSTTYVSGTSGYDYSSLIEAEYQEALSESYTLADEVSEDQAIVAAYEEMETYLQEFEDALTTLTDTATDTDDNVFDDKAAYLTSDSDVPADNIMGVLVEDDAVSGSYQIEVEQIATAHKIASDTVADADADLGLDGTFNLSTATGRSVDIAIDATTSLNDLVDLINSETDETGVSASVLQVSETEFMMVLTASNTNEEITFATVSGDDVAQSLGIIDGAGIYQNELQAAEPAILTIDGVTVERDSNSIDDLLEGVTISLYTANPGTTITLEVAEDLSGIKEAVQAFVDAYNNYRNFAIVQQATTTSGEASADAVLFGDSLLRNANSEIYNLLNTSVEYGDDEVLSLASFGITFNWDNTLTIDGDVLDEVLLSEPEKIEAFFSFNATTSSSDLGITAHDGIFGDMDFDMNITIDGAGDVTSVDVGGDVSLFTIDGKVISGAEGTEYEGLSFIYTGDATTTVNISISQGIADQMRYSLDSWANESSGILSEIINDMEESISDKNEEISEIESDAANYYDDLVEYYAELEAEIAEYEAVLDTLTALTNED